MYSQTYLCNRKDQKTYYGRIRVPLDIQHVYGKKEVKRALRTTDLREAKRRVQVWALKLLQEFDEVRRKLGGGTKARHILYRAKRVWRKTHADTMSHPAILDETLPWFSGRIRIYEYR